VAAAGPGAGSLRAADITLSIRRPTIQFDPGRVERLHQLHAQIYNRRSGRIRPLPGARAILDYLTEAQIAHLRANGVAVCSELEIFHDRRLFFVTGPEGTARRTARNSASRQIQRSHQDEQQHAEEASRSDQPDQAGRLKPAGRSHAPETHRLTQ